MSFKFIRFLLKQRQWKITASLLPGLPDSAGLAAGPCSCAVFKLNKYGEAVYLPA